MAIKGIHEKSSVLCRYFPVNACGKYLYTGSIGGGNQPGADRFGLFDVSQVGLLRGDYLINKPHLESQFMYLDTVIVVSIAVILAMLVGGGWLGVYAYKQIRQDAASQKKSDDSSER